MLNSARKTNQLMTEAIAYGVAAGAIVYQGGMVALDGGFAAPGAEGENLACVGVAFATVDNSDGADGDREADCRAGIYHFDNDATSPVTIADVGADCFMVDDHTVSKDGTGRSVAGKIKKVDAGGVWVKF